MTPRARILARLGALETEARRHRDRHRREAQREAERGRRGWDAVTGALVSLRHAEWFDSQVWAYRRAAEAVAKAIPGPRLRRPRP